MSDSPDYLKHTLGVDTRLSMPPAQEMIDTIFRERFRAAPAYHHASNLVDMAYVVKLLERGIVPLAAGRQILAALRELDTVPAGEFPFEPRFGDVYFARESYLSGRLGDETGGWMHVGRSRGEVNDAAMRLVLRRGLLEVADGARRLQATLLDVAGVHRETVMAGYSQFLHGQIVSFGHYLLGYAYPMQRDVTRLVAAFRTMNLSPLGCGVLAGSSFPVDREGVAALLGFDGILRHPRDAVWLSQDCFIETGAAVSLLMVGVARLAADLALWAGSEYALIELADEYCGTSSIMPQKKNPISLEYVRGLAGLGAGRLMSLLSISKEPSDQIDFSIFYPGLLLPYLDEVTASLGLVEAIVRTMSVRHDRMIARAGSEFAQASSMAEFIVREAGRSWRVAHRIVGRLVRMAVERGLTPDRLTGALFDEAAMAVTGSPLGFSDDVVRQVLDPRQILRDRTLPGGTAPEEVGRMLDECRRATAEQGRIVGALQDRIAQASQDVGTVVDRVLAPGS